MFHLFDYKLTESGFRQEHYSTEMMSLGSVCFASINSWIKVWILVLITPSASTHFDFHPLSWKQASFQESTLKSQCSFSAPCVICVFISWLLVNLLHGRDAAETQRKRVRKILCGADSSAISRAISIMLSQLFEWYCHMH